MPTPALADQAIALARSGQAARAIELLRREASAGSAEALYVLANWCLAGDIIQRNLPLSRDLFRQAAEAGHAAGAAAYRAFLANGTGGPRDWAKALTLLEAAAREMDVEAERQLLLIRQMRLSAAGDPKGVSKPERLGDRPEILLFRGLFSSAECDFLVESAAPLFEPSTVVDPATGALVPNPIRSSDGAAFPLVMEDPAIHALNRRLAVASGTRPEQGEPLQVLRYRPGQEYRAHSDALPHTDNQRTLTFLLYLNEDYDGGETAFLRIGVKVKGRKGDGLLFQNADGENRPDPLALHAGLPVTRGTKLIASRWIRAKPLDLTRPLGAA